MTKIKLAIWGITDDIWNSVINTIDPRRADILFFIDNDLEIVGKVYQSRPIYALDVDTLIKLNEMDYVLIAAYSGYRQIEGTLLEKGYPEEKIQLYITENMTAYNLGNVVVDYRLIDMIYFEPRTKRAEVENYQKAFSRYVNLRGIDEDTGRWYEKGPLIAHACGGYVNGRRIMYSNSHEALKHSLLEGYRLIECDVLGIEQNEVMLAHDYNRFYEAKEEEYTMQSISEMLAELKKYPQVYMLIDVKWSEVDDYTYYVKKILESIRELTNDNIEFEQLKSQIIMEVYEEETIMCAQHHGFDVFFTQYRNPNIKNYIDTIRLCVKYNIGVVGFGLKYIMEHQKVINLFKEKNIKIYVFSTDSIDEYKELRRIGVDGIFTNYLSYGDIV